MHKYVRRKNGPYCKQINASLKPKQLQNQEFFWILITNSYCYSCLLWGKIFFIFYKLWALVLPFHSLLYLILSLSSCLSDIPGFSLALMKLKCSLKANKQTEKPPLYSQFSSSLCLLLWGRGKCCQELYSAISNLAQ